MNPALAIALWPLPAACAGEAPARPESEASNAGGRLDRAGPEEPRIRAAYDLELVRRFVGGDESAFCEIVRRYEDRVLAVAKDLLHNLGDAEEIKQDTFIRAYRGLAHFRGEASLATWLHRIALNLARNRYWYFFRRRRQATISLDAPVGDESGQTVSEFIVADAPDPARARSRKEFAELAVDCMARLDPRHRLVLEMRNIQGKSYSDIAAQLGINVGTVKSRIARARESLRALIAASCPEFAPDSEPEEWFEPSHRSIGRAAMALA